jgi:hypothetical protein
LMTQIGKKEIDGRVPFRKVISWSECELELECNGQKAGAIIHHHHPHRTHNVTGSCLSLPPLRYPALSVICHREIVFFHFHFHFHSHSHSHSNSHSFLLLALSNLNFFFVTFGLFAIPYLPSQRTTPANAGDQSDSRTMRPPRQTSHCFFRVARPGLSSVSRISETLPCEILPLGLSHCHLGNC